MDRLSVPAEELNAEPRRLAIGGMVQLHDVVAEPGPEPEGGGRPELHLAMCSERRGRP